MQSVRQWLEQLGLPEYSEVFKRNDVDLELLRELTDTDLEKVGVHALGHRKKLLKAIAQLNETEVSMPGTQALQNQVPLREPIRTDAERRQLTVLFCDLVGSTALAQKLDPEELRDLMQAYQGACGRIIERYDGHIAQYLGDGLMVYFGWPHAHEDDAQRAVRAGLDMIEAIQALQTAFELSARVGIATGPVVVGDNRGDRRADAGLAVGETPNLAARIQGIAGANTVVIADATRRLVGGAFDLEPLGAQILKGIDAAVTLNRVVGDASAEDRFEARIVGGLTPFVGREHEIGLLIDRWQQAGDGEGQVVLLSGEPGIGKSRVTQVLRERVAQEPHTRLRCQCSPYYTNSAFYPMITQMERAAGFERDDTAELKLQKLEMALSLGTDDVASAARLIGAMMSLPTDRYPPLNLPPQKQKELIISALADHVIGLARRQAVLMVFEDVHWIDPTTLEVLAPIINRIQNARVLLLITYRPEFDPPWTGYGHLTTITLNRLSRRQGSAMVERVTGGKALPDEVLDQIVAKTDGVPLFVEELTKTVLEAGFLRDAGDHYELDGPLPPLAIPSTLQDSLVARLDRLSPVKEVAQIGACIGREFPYELLAAVSALRDAELQDALRQLVSSELIFARGVPPSATYAFKHALVQDAAYGSLLKTRRLQLHSSLAETLEQKFPGIADSHPELVAHHLTEAARPGPAIEYWTRAGRIASERSANPEAIAYLNKAMALLPLLPESARPDELELRLLNLIAAPLMNTRGYAAPEAGKAYRRMHELCDRTGVGEHIYQALSGVCQYHMVVGDMNLALGIAEQTIALANRQDNLDPVLEAHRLMGLSLLWAGRLRSSIDHFRKVQELFDPARRQHLALTYGQDHLMSSYAMSGLPLALFGLPDQAKRSSASAIEEARKTNHAYSYAYAISSPQFVFAFLGDTERLRQTVEQAIAFCSEQGMAFSLTYSLVHRGHVFAQLGDIDAGIAQMREGFKQYRAAGSGMFVPYFRTLLAQAMMRCAAWDEAELLLDEATEEMRRWGEVFYDAETRRVRGDLALARKDIASASPEQWYQQAIEIARRQEAKLLELRASTSLARLWGERGERQKAFDLLAPVYDWFSEGFDTKDLKEAQGLLDALRC